ncbi:MAG: hypothetical protein GY708_29905 [Actinomycetia bacterium]|nr:hypothetical protein [Actinomycetes bacterium]MCP4958576.1 hypothetical protein [Actinomycetes bacterium]
MADKSTDKLIPEWDVEEDHQIAIVGTVIGLVMLFGVFGYAGFALVEKVFSG